MGIGIRIENLRKVYDTPAPSAARGGGFSFMAQRSAGSKEKKEKKKKFEVVALDDISCASTSDCWVVGSDPLDGSGVVVATTDAGKIWEMQSLPKKVGNLNDVSCASASHCWVTGGSIDKLRGSGRSTMSADASRLGKSGIVVSTGGPGLVLTTTDGGKRWKSEALPSGTSDPFGISCPSTTACWAVGTTTNEVVILSLGAPPPPASNGGHHRARGGQRR